jgi:Fe-S cluster assembly protein SufD
MSIQVSAKPELSYLDGLLSEAVGGATKVVPENYAIAPETAAWLQQVRDNAATWVRELAIPTTKDEEWRFTDLSPLLAVNFEAGKPLVLPSEALTPFELSQEASRVTFVNGVYAPQLSKVTDLPDGVFVGNLGQLPPGLRDRLPEYLTAQEGGKEVFTALNTSGLVDAAVVWLPKNAIVETPIQFLFLATNGETASLIQPRALVVAEGGSACTLLEEYVVAEREWCDNVKHGQPYFTNAVTEIWLGDNAQVKHARIQREAHNAFHIGKTAIAQGRDSHYECTAVSTGAKLARHHLDVFQKGEGTHTVLNGLSVVRGEQVADTHSAIALNYPHGSSQQLHKTIVDDRAQSVFNGKVFVPKPAQLTDASQLNRNLLLSPKARVHTKPQLQITADNVKCSHGATVSQLEEDELFYLRSRGLDPNTSRNLLVDGFAGEILDRLPLKRLQTRLARCIACRTDNS